MITIRELHYKEKDFLKDVVNIHLKSFKGFFLTFMGKGFLKKMYQSYCQHNESGIYVYFEDDKLQGFLAFSGNYSDLFKYMIKTKLIYFFWYSFCAFIRKPKVFVRLFRALFKPKETKKEEKYLELASIAVDPDAMSKGIGSQLIARLKEDTDFEKYEYITLETDAINNDRAISFYKKNGFVENRLFETHEGRKMYEFRYKK